MRLTAREMDELERVKRWGTQLYRLLNEMEEFNGDPPQGVNPPKLECLTRFAWEEAHDVRRHLERRHREAGPPDHVLMTPRPTQRTEAS